MPDIFLQENNGKLLERRNAALEERYVVQTAMASMAHVASSRAVRAPEDNLGSYVLQLWNECLNLTRESFYPGLMIEGK